jgi:hypothetical protein
LIRVIPFGMSDFNELVHDHDEANRALEDRPGVPMVQYRIYSFVK